MLFRIATSITLLSTFNCLLFPIFIGNNCQLSTVYAQASQELFGRNRVQYKYFDFSRIKTHNFEIYYYQGGYQLAKLTAQYAESDYERITDLIGFSPYSKMKLIIYNSISDLQQSNIGLDMERYQVGGKITIIKNKAEVAFPGTQTGFKREISYWIAKMLLNEMIYGGSFMDMMQSSYLLSLPDWFMDGCAKYIAEGWSIEMDDFIRDALVEEGNKGIEGIEGIKENKGNSEDGKRKMENGKRKRDKTSKNFEKPSQLIGLDALMAGQSIWNFIALQYGKENISSILNLTRITRNAEQSIEGTLGLLYYRFIDDWRKYYKSMTKSIVDKYDKPETTFRIRENNRKGFVYNNIRFSPDGNFIAYSENYKGRYTVVIYDHKLKKYKNILRGGQQTIDQKVDYNIPLLTWQSAGILSIIEIKRGKLILSNYNIHNNNVLKRTFQQFTQILGFDYSNDGNMLILSAVKDGQSDIYIYNLRSDKMKQITDDLYDDIDPHFMPDAVSILFSSNRKNDTLKIDKCTFRDITDNFDIFLYDLKKSNDTLYRIPSNTLKANETKPMGLDNENIIYLSDEKGIKNLYKYNLLTHRKQALSSFQQNINEFDIKNSIAFLITNKGKEYIYYYEDFDFDPKHPAINISTYRRKIVEEGNREIEESGNRRSGSGSSSGKNQKSKIKNKKYDKFGDEEINIDDYRFNTGAEVQGKDTYTMEDGRWKMGDGKPKIDTMEYGKSKIATGYSSSDSGHAEQKSKIENIFISFPYPYELSLSAHTITSSISIDPLLGFGLVLDIGLTDILEDHKIYGGILGLTDFRSSKYFAEYYYLKHRVDLSVSYDIQNLLFSDLFIPISRFRLQKVNFTMSYPFTTSKSIRFTPFFIQTRYTILDPQNFPDSVTNFVGYNSELIFDNSIVHGLNIVEGTRFKVRLNSYFALQDKKKNFNNLKIDLRHYQKIYRQIIVATRLSYGYSFGNAAKLFLLGGMDNWWFHPSTDFNEPPVILHDINDLLFLSYATNLRGFNYNARNGNQYFLFNAELRIPMIRYFKKSAISSNFFRNLQLSTFIDSGTAWSGKNPLSRDNNYNKMVVGGGNNPFKATVTNYRNIIVSGYGFGIRSMILGYYMKFDLAWGVEDYQVQKPKLYWTLGYDF